MDEIFFYKDPVFFNMVKKEVKKHIAIDGHKIKNIEEFFDEVQRKLCPGFKGFGRNWDAFNDVLREVFPFFSLESQ